MDELDELRKQGLARGEATQVRLLEGTLTAVRLQPGDVLVIQGPRLTREDRALLREEVQQLFPGHELVFVPPGMTLGVVTPTCPPADAPADVEK